MIHLTPPFSAPPMGRVEKERSRKGLSLFDERFVHLDVCLAQVEKELNEICHDVLTVLDKHLIPAASTGESKVFYYKM